MSTERKLQFETLQLHVGQEQPDPATGSRAVPIYQTTSYVFDNSQHAADRFGLRDAGNIYGRLTNSTQGVFEERIAALEGGVAGLAVASGAAAVSYVIQALAAQGEHIVAQKTIYGGTSNLLEHTYKRFGIDATFRKTRKPSIWKLSAIRIVIFRILKPLPNWRMNETFRSLWIIPLERLSGFDH